MAGSRSRQLVRRIRHGPRLIGAAEGGGRVGLAAYLVQNLLSQAAGLPASAQELDLRLKPGIQVTVETFSSQLGAYVDVFQERVYGQLPGFLGQAGQVIVDAGAHVGFYTIWQALSTGAAGRIYAFEPNPPIYALLARNVERNGLDWARCLPYALSDREGVFTMQAAPRGSSSARVVDSALEATKPTFKVRGTTLDAFVEEQRIARIDVLKMDTEGAEAAIVRGGLRRALPLTRRVVMESHKVRGPGEQPGRTREQVRDLLAPLGFRLVLDHRGGKIVYFER